MQEKGPESDMAGFQTEAAELQMQCMASGIVLLISLLWS